MFWKSDKIIKTWSVLRKEKILESIFLFFVPGQNNYWLSVPHMCVTYLVCPMFFNLTCVKVFSFPDWIRRDALYIWSCALPKSWIFIYSVRRYLAKILIDVLLLDMMSFLENKICWFYLLGNFFCNFTAAGSLKLNGNVTFFCDWLVCHH